MLVLTSMIFTALIAIAVNFSSPKDDGYICFSDDETKKEICVEQETQPSEMK